MAGRPVAARGGSGMTYALVTFVILAVAGLGAFIWQFTINKGLQDAADRAQRSMNEIGSPPSYYREEARARNNRVADVMNDDLQKFSFLIAGTKEAVRPAVESEANGVVSAISKSHPSTVSSGDTLLKALRSLDSALASSKQQIRALQDEKGNLQLENQRLAEGGKAAQDEFTAALGEQKTEVDRLQKETTDQLAAKDEQLASQVAAAQALEEEYNRFRADKQAQDRENEVTFGRMKNQIEDLQKKLAAVRPQVDINAILTKADGRILRAIPGSDIVYINLGEADNLKPGHTFEVFSTTGERRADYRGKASLEVALVMEQTAECRVTRSTYGVPILEGDIVVNIAYERNRKPRFVVAGEFDLDHDGTADWDGREKVLTIIREWGGVVMEELDETTDFVIIGAGPRVPAIAGDRPVSAIVSDLSDTKTKELAEYRDLISRAQGLYIPVVNQSQFLFLTGYAGEKSITQR